MRGWKTEPRVSEYSNLADAHVYFANRDDDVAFMLRTNLPSDKAREEFDTFLAPTCECIVGKNCAMHDEQWQEKIRNA